MSEVLCVFVQRMHCVYWHSVKSTECLAWHHLLTVHLSSQGNVHMLMMPVRNI